MDYFNEALPIPTPEGELYHVLGVLGETPNVFICQFKLHIIGEKAEIRGEECEDWD